MKFPKRRGGSAVQPPLTRGQAGWRWCKQCRGLVFADQPRDGVCVGGTHDLTAGSEYVVSMNQPQTPDTQSGWRCCRRCSGLFFGSNHSLCWQGGQHDPYSSEYSVSVVPSGQSQDGWTWCKSCHLLFYGSGLGSVCPSGDIHDGSSSQAYFVERA